MKTLCLPKIIAFALLSFSLFLASCKKDEDVHIPAMVVRVSQSNVLMVAGETSVQTITARVLASDSVPIAGVKVFFKVGQGKASISATEAISDSNGAVSVQMTPVDQVQVIGISATVPEIARNAALFAFSIIAGPPAKIEVQSGNRQEALANRALPSPIVVKVTDKFGNPVSDVPVSYRLKSGNGSLGIASPSTFNGLASFQFTTGAGMAVSVVTASVSADIQTDVTIYTLLPVQVKSGGQPNKNLISWTKSTSPNFQRYKLYRSRWGFSGTESLLTQSDDVNTTSYEDAATNVGFVYSYYVSTETRQGDKVDSDPDTSEGGTYLKLNDGYDLDICFDSQRGLIYLPITNSGKILILSSTTLQKVDSIMYNYDRNLARITLSTDFTKLYILKGQFTFDVFDLATRTTIKTVDLSAIMGSGSVMDIYMTNAGDIFVSGNYIVKVDVANNYAQTKVAGGRLFSQERPRFLAENSGYLYVEDDLLSPNSLYKLDISQAVAPLVAEDVHGTIGMSGNATLLADGTKLYLNGGQIVNTSDFSVAGTLPQPTYAATLSTSGDKLYTTSAAMFSGGRVTAMNRSTFAIEKQWDVGFQSPRMVFFDNALYFLTELSFPSGQWRLYKIDLN